MSDFEYFFIKARTFPMFPFSGTPQEQESFSTKHANLRIKLRDMNTTCKYNKDQRSIKKITEPVQDYVPKVPLKCQAVNLNNSPCKFKAVSCGKFCKKHQVSAEMLALIE